MPAAVLQPHLLPGVFGRVLEAVYRRGRRESGDLPRAGVCEAGEGGGRGGGGEGGYGGGVAEVEVVEG